MLLDIISLRTWSWYSLSSGMDSWECFQDNYSTIPGLFNSITWHMQDYQLLFMQYLIMNILLKNSRLSQSITHLERRVIPLKITLICIDRIFKRTSFWKWIISGALQAFPVSIFTFFIMAKTAIDEEGHMADFWTAGMTSFTIVVLITNLKMFIFSYSYNLITILGIFGSIGAYLLSYWSFSKYYRRSGIFNEFDM